MIFRHFLVGKSAKKRDFSEGGPFCTEQICVFSTILGKIPTRLGPKNPKNKGRDVSESNFGHFFLTEPQLGHYRSVVPSPEPSQDNFRRQTTRKATPPLVSQK